MKTILAMAAMLIVLAPAVHAADMSQELGLTGPQSFGFTDKVGKNEAKFSSKAPLEDIDGTADGISGQFMLNPANIETSKGKVEVRVASMQTGIKKRDEHMFSATWLDAETHPTISFDIKKLTDVKVTSKSDAKVVLTAKAHGSFVMRGVEREMVTDVTLTILPESEKTRERAPGDFLMVKTAFAVPLSAHNVAGKGDIIGSKVSENIQVEVNLYGTNGMAR